MCCRRNTFMYAHIYGCACSLPLKHRFLFFFEKLTLFFDHKKDSLQTKINQFSESKLKI